MAFSEIDRQQTDSPLMNSGAVFYKIIYTREMTRLFFTCNSQCPFVELYSVVNEMCDNLHGCGRCPEIEKIYRRQNASAKVPY